MRGPVQIRLVHERLWIFGVVHPCDAVVVDEMSERGKEPQSVLHHRTADGRRLTIFVVNPTNKPVPAALDISDIVTDPGNVAIQTLADREDRGKADVTNSFERSDVVTQPSDVELPSGGKLTYKCPRLSLVVLRF